MMYTVISLMVAGVFSAYAKQGDRVEHKFVTQQDFSDVSSPFYDVNKHNAHLFEPSNDSIPCVVARDCDAYCIDRCHAPFMNISSASECLNGECACTLKDTTFEEQYGQLLLCFDDSNCDRPCKAHCGRRLYQTASGGCKDLTDINGHCTCRIENEETDKDLQLSFSTAYSEDDHPISCAEPKECKHNCANRCDKPGTDFTSIRSCHNDRVNCSCLMIDKTTRYHFVPCRDDYQCQLHCNSYCSRRMGESAQGTCIHYDNHYEPKDPEESFQGRCQCQIFNSALYVNENTPVLCF